ncbi:ATP-dependent protease [Rhodococcus sp. WMMA185]|uniref:LON peptidase substrate-binding domain-containing protein n=1 Tax=Rhodococcus sp. WMMA185 TaxID=679318 RepID=UPI0008783B61|nr:LON peptidase substrate-binding domain-containing protein [Rhodococcus sp. WMMA185]AOW91631.1 ATP-dependent protease [Rhodococcus sp. WMMA185]
MFVLPMFPLGLAMLPGQPLPLHVFEHRYQQLVRDCLDAPGDPLFGVVLIARGTEIGGGDVRHDVGTLARIESHVAIGDGRYELFCRTRERIKVSKWLPDNPYPIAEVDLWPDENSGIHTTDAEYRSLIDRVEFLYDLLGRLAAETGNIAPDIPDIQDLQGDLGAKLFEIATYIPMGDADRHGILAAAGGGERLAEVSEVTENAIEMVRFRLM